MYYVGPIASPGRFVRPSVEYVDARSVVVSYKRKYVHEVLVNRLFKLAQKKNMVR